MKKTKALSLLLAASLVLPQFAVFASAEGEETTTDYTEVEAANLNSFSDTAYTGADDPDLEAGEWAATDATYLELSGGESGLTAAKKNGNDKLPTKAQVMYAFENPLPAGDYVLTLVVDTKDEASGWMSMLGAVDAAKTKISTNHKDVTSSPYTYTVQFTVPEGDPIPVGFRYYSNGEVDPAFPYSITSMTLEKRVPKVFESDIFNEKPNTMEAAGATSTTDGYWAVKPEAGRTGSITFDSENKRIVLESKAEEAGKPFSRFFYAIDEDLPIGKYVASFDSCHIRSDGKEADYRIRMKFRVYNGGSQIVTEQNGPLEYTGTEYEFTIPFEVTAANPDIILEFWANHSSDTDKVEFYIDNYELTGTPLYENRAKVESYDFTNDNPTINTNATTDSSLLNPENRGKWSIRSNNNAIGAVELTHKDGALNVAARETAIYGKPTVMYRFEKDLAVGKHKVDVAIKTLAEAGSGDTYTVSLYDTDGNQLGDPQELTLGVNSNTGKATIPFTLDDKANVVLCIQSTKTDAAFTNAFQVTGATLYSEDVDTGEGGESGDDDNNDTTEAGVTFAVVTETGKTYYNAGDTFTATIVATAKEPTDVYSFDFALDYSDTLTMVKGSFEATGVTDHGVIVDGQKEGQDRFAWYVIPGSIASISVTEEEVPVATVQFTVKDSLADEHIDMAEAEITVSDARVGLDNGVKQEIADAQSAKVFLYDIEITVDGENIKLGALNLEGNKLYARYDEAGLYSAETRTEENAYDLAENLEPEDDYAITGYKFDNGEGAKEIDLGNFPFVESGTLTAIATEKVTVTIEVLEGTKGEVKGYGGALLEVPGQTLETILTNNNIKAEPINENYEFVGWFDVDDKAVALSDTINANITIHPVFEGVNLKDKVTDSYLNAFKNGDGVNEIITEVDTITVNVAQFGEPLKVTVGEAPDGYFLENVTYTQGGNETDMELETESGNVYVSTDALDSVEPITVTAYYSKRVTVTFVDEGKVDFVDYEDGTQPVFYAKQYQGVLYTKDTCTESDKATTDDIPEFTYVENGDTQSVKKDNENAWLIGEEDYDNTDLLTFAYEGDTTITPNTDTAFRITFKIAEGDTVIGRLEGTAEFWRKSGVTMSDITPPNIIIENNPDQYEKKFVDDKDKKDFDPNTTITGPATYTAVATANSYTVSLENEDGMLEISSDSKPTYNEDFVFTVSLKTDAAKGYIAPTTVTYKVEVVEGEPEELTLTAEDGVFTIGGENITNNITITAVAAKVTFELTVPENVTVKVKGEEVVDNKAYYQVDDTVTIKAAGVLISGITYTVEGLAGEFKADYANGEYTLDKTKLVGNVALTVNTLNVTFDYILKERKEGDDDKDGYEALANKTMILLVKDIDDTKVVALADETQVFWSGKYGAHVAIVADSATANDLAHGMTITEATGENPVVRITYNGDVNGDGETRAADAAYVSYMLHQSLIESDVDFTDIERLEADFSGNGMVSTADCEAIARVFTGNKQQGN